MLLYQEFIICLFTSSLLYVMWDPLCISSTSIYYDFIICLFASSLLYVLLSGSSFTIGSTSIYSACTMTLLFANLPHLSGSSLTQVSTLVLCTQLRVIFIGGSQLIEHQEDEILLNPESLARSLFASSLLYVLWGSSLHEFYINLLFAYLPHVFCT